MFKQEEDFLALLLLGSFLFSLGAYFFGVVVGADLERERATKETTIFCIQQPKECKIKYDFYTLENTK